MEIETQEHVLEKRGLIHGDKTRRITHEHLFTEDVQKLEKAAHTIKEIMDELNGQDKQNREVQPPRGEGTPATQASTPR